MFFHDCFYFTSFLLLSRPATMHCAPSSSSSSYDWFSEFQQPLSHDEPTIRTTTTARSSLSSSSSNTARHASTLAELEKQYEQYEEEDDDGNNYVLPSSSSDQTKRRRVEPSSSSSTDDHATKFVTDYLNRLRAMKTRDPSSPARHEEETRTTTETTTAAAATAATTTTTTNTRRSSTTTAATRFERAFERSNHAIMRADVVPNALPIIEQELMQQCSDNNNNNTDAVHEWLCHFLHHGARSLLTESNQRTNQRLAVSCFESQAKTWINTQRTEHEWLSIIGRWVGVRITREWYYGDGDDETQLGHDAPQYTIEGNENSLLTDTMLATDDDNHHRYCARIFHLDDSFYVYCVFRTSAHTDLWLFCGYFYVQSMRSHVVDLVVVVATTSNDDGCGDAR
jgi:hypothetical protein